MAKPIYLSNSIKIAWVDDEDYPIIRWHSFNLSANGYPRTSIRGKTFCLHNLILNDPPPGMTPDHKDRDKLNNRRDNLKYSNESEQKINRDTLKSNTSGETNIHFNKLAGNYAVRYRKNGKRIHVGYFSTLQGAKDTLAKCKNA